VRYSPAVTYSQHQSSHLDQDPWSHHIEQFVCVHVNMCVPISVNALRILRYDSIHVIYRAVVIAKLMYASSVWWGFTTADNR